MSGRGLPRVHRRRLALILVLLAVYAVVWIKDRFSAAPAGSGDAAVEAAFESQTSGRMLEVEAVVERLLDDDLEGSRHQRLIVRLDSGSTLLVSHNIDLAPRVPAAVGDRLEVRGQYEWNEQGGLLHWTHHDPAGRRPGGWIRHRGKTFD